MASHHQFLNAQLLVDERGSVRCTVGLGVKVPSVSDQARVLVHDLSETGLRLETTSVLTLGEFLVVELPFVAVVEARIVRKDVNIYGCQFLTPVSEATVKAALLRSRPLRPVPTNETNIFELVVGINPSGQEIAIWALEFEQVQSLQGFQLLGFRKSDDGIINAIVLKKKQ